MRRARCAQELGHRLREDPRRERDSSSGDWEFATTTSRAVAAEGLAGFLRGGAGGYGSHRGLLEAHLLHARRRLQLWLRNARHLKNVPGRKTDVKDAEWICQLVEHGLVRPSFVPPKEIRSLGSSRRYRKAQIEERTREVQRLEKVLQDAGIKLSSVATRVLGASGRAMLDALVGEPPTRRSWGSSPGAGFAPSCEDSGMLWREASPPIMPSWWTRYRPTSTTSMSP